MTRLEWCNLRRAATGRAFAGPHVASAPAPFQAQQQPNAEGKTEACREFFKAHVRLLSPVSAACSKPAKSPPKQAQPTERDASFAVGALPPAKAAAVQQGSQWPRVSPLLSRHRVFQTLGQERRPAGAGADECRNHGYEEQNRFWVEDV